MWVFTWISSILCWSHAASRMQVGQYFHFWLTLFTKLIKTWNYSSLSCLHTKFQWKTIGGVHHWAPNPDQSTLIYQKSCEIVITARLYLLIWNSISLLISPYLWHILVFIFVLHITSFFCHLVSFTRKSAG